MLSTNHSAGSRLRKPGSACHTGRVLSIQCRQRPGRGSEQSQTIIMGGTEGAATETADSGVRKSRSSSCVRLKGGNRTPSRKRSVSGSRKRRNSMLKRVRVSDSNEVFLKHAWTFWYDEQPHKGMTHAEYESSVVRIGTFDTIQAFWRYYNNIVDPAVFPAYSNLRMFKANIKPLWEDPANSNGGKWVGTSFTVLFAPLLYPFASLALPKLQLRLQQFTGCASGQERRCFYVYCLAVMCVDVALGELCVCIEFVASIAAAANPPALTAADHFRAKRANGKVLDPSHFVRDCQSAHPHRRRRT